ncbi:MAG: prenyltransferase/squalene oxidase repeat-containing protein [Planctomycetota bacterium]|nr:prenyltransferase/squalene oxidase repeat-containing protein [Planctomycetota bacterium]
MASPSRSLSRRDALSLLAGALGGSAALMAAPAFARDRETRGTPEPRDARRRRQKAIRKACAWLASKQGPSGSFGDNRAVIALTSLSVLALMSEGSTDGRGRYGAAVRKGINWLLKLIEDKGENDSQWHPGYFEYQNDTTSRMHGQGYATLALASALGTSSDRDRFIQIRKVLVKAVDCCEQAQTSTGGYGYRPIRGGDHEGSVTVTIAQGLRAARDAGLRIDPSVVERGLQYLRRSQKRDGSFKYSTRQDQSTYALTAAALSAFFLFGQYEDETGLVPRAIDYIRKQIGTGRGPDQPWYYYGHFYGAWACWQWDGHTWDKSRRNLWGWWQNIVYPHMIDRQTTEGQFEPEGGRYDFGPILSTAFGVLTLAIPDEVLPIFQR